MAPNPRSFMKNWFAVEAIPLYMLLSVAITGASWFAYRQSHSPEVVWTKRNAEPWNTIKPDQSVKMFNVNNKLDKSWHRDRL